MRNVMDSNQTTIQLRPAYPHPHMSLYNPSAITTMPSLSIASGLSLINATNGSSSNDGGQEIQSSNGTPTTNTPSPAQLVPVTNGVCLNTLQIQQLQMHQQQSFSQMPNQCGRASTGTQQQPSNQQLLQIHITTPSLSAPATDVSSASISNCKDAIQIMTTSSLMNDTSSNLSNGSTATSTSSDVAANSIPNRSIHSTTKQISTQKGSENQNNVTTGTNFVNLARASCSNSNSSVSAISMKLSSSESSFAKSSLKSTHGKGFKCQLCNRDFTQKGNLKTHLMTHSGERPYECQTCGKNFTQKGNLDTHVKIHTETKDHKCQYCDRGFTQRGNLKTHIRSIHTKEKPYACGHCGKSFSQKGNMLTHYRTHDKDARFPCNICGKTFSQKGNLKTHQQRHGRASTR